MDEPSNSGPSTPPDPPPPDSLLWDALPDLTLNIAQTAALCGVSVRQLGYWTRQGYVAGQGSGARRTYGLESVRRILAIRKAMDGGASLRQSLRQVSDPAPADSRPRPPLRHAAPPPAAEDQQGRADAVARSLTALFDANRHTRDHAGGLAVKLGWAEEDVRAVAERLCAEGILARTVCLGLTVFRRAAPGGPPHA